nr:hypothetical protein [Aliiroseovarius sp. xm-m-379]
MQNPTQETKGIQNHKKPAIFRNKDRKDEQIYSQTNIEHPRKGLLSGFMPQTFLSDLSSQSSTKKKPHLQSGFTNAPVPSFRPAFIQEHQKVADGTGETKPTKDK